MAPHHLQLEAMGQEEAPHSQGSLQARGLAQGQPALFPWVKEVTLGEEENSLPGLGASL